MHGTYRLACEESIKNSLVASLKAFFVFSTYLPTLLSFFDLCEIVFLNSRIKKLILIENEMSLSASSKKIQIARKSAGRFRWVRLSGCGYDRDFADHSPRTVSTHRCRRLYGDGS